MINKIKNELEEYLKIIEKENERFTTKSIAELNKDKIDFNIDSAIGRLEMVQDNIVIKYYIKDLLEYIKCLENNQNNNTPKTNEDRVIEWVNNLSDEQKIQIASNNLSVDKNDNFKMCRESDCGDCIFFGDYGGCLNNFKRWLKEEV